MNLGAVLAWYWHQSEGNVVAMPACAAVAVAFAVCCRRPVAAWWHRHFGARQDLAELRAVAEAARRIAADLHERVTGERHPDAPE